LWEAQRGNRHQIPNQYISHHHRDQWPSFFLVRHFLMNTIEISKWLKAKIKGKKSTTDSLKSAVILKTRPKQYFLAIKVPKSRGVIFCPPPFSGLFLRGEKWFSRLVWIFVQHHNQQSLAAVFLYNPAFDNPDITQHHGRAKRHR
jgi:hypothetical protein